MAAFDRTASPLCRVSRVSMAPRPPLVALKNVRLQDGQRPLFEGVDLAVEPRTRAALVGRNGAGKSTLMKMVMGLIEPDSGDRSVQAGTRFAYVPQEPVITGDTLLDYAASEGAERWTAEAWLTTFGLDPEKPAINLSGGETRRAALAKAFAEEPDLLLLDEPTNHLDAESVAWLQNYLKEYPGCVILVTHDRYFLDQITDWTLELVRGSGVPYKGNYSSWLEQKAKREEVEAGAEESKAKLLKRELEWIRSSPKARQAKSKARITAFEKLNEEAGREEIGKAQIQISRGPRLGEQVIEVEGLSKGFGDRLLIDNLSFKLPPGGIVGIIGPNGAGKTTLFRMITGQEKPDKGTIKFGSTVRLSYVDQSRAHLDDKKTVWEEISGGLDMMKLSDKREINSRAYCGWFNFKGADQQKKVGLLSGGERNRVHLAKMLKEGGNVLLLDEPTNDLDTETLSSLEAALEDFPGCAVVISHDRFFLDRLATHILAFEGDSHVEWFEGNFEAYEADKKRRLGDAAVEPHRIKFKKFER
jgi:ATP-binding cassette ChvD family protein